MMNDKICDQKRTCAPADRSAGQAVKKVFAILGVDVSKPESLEAFREDLRFGRKMRQTAEHGRLAAVAAIAVGICAALWSGITIKMGGG